MFSLNLGLLQSPLPSHGRNTNLFALSPSDAAVLKPLGRMIVDGVGGRTSQTFLFKVRPVS